MSIRKKVAPATKLVYVRWFDSAIYKGEACQPEDIDYACEMESSGLLIREDKKTITLALDRCIDTKDVRLVLTIPKVNVLYVRRFSA